MCEGGSLYPQNENKGRKEESGGMAAHVISPPWSSPPGPKKSSVLGLTFY